MCLRSPKPLISESLLGAQVINLIKRNQCLSGYGSDQPENVLQ